MRLRWGVDTSFAGDDKIVQEVWSEVDDVRQTIIRQVINMQEAQLRQALIGLGWTPPGGTGASARSASRKG
jgi:hypothetical protein